MDRKNKLAAAYNLITSEEKKPAKKERMNPVGVVLTEDQKNKLDGISKELGKSRHFTMILAIKKLIADWDNGWRPKKSERTIEEYEIE